jgi:hypothetical protein
MKKDRYYIINPAEYPLRKLKIYLLPASEDPGHFGMMFPKGITKGTPASGKWKIGIAGFPGIEGALEAEVRERVHEKLEAEIASGAGRKDMLFSTGVILTVLSIVNWVLPDPLIIVDEVFMTASGIILSILGWRGRRNKDLHQEKLTDLEMQLREVDVEENPTLSLLYQAVKERESSEKSSGFAGDIEAETEWMVRLFDFGSLVSEGKTDPAELEEISNIISRFLPLKELARLEKKTGGSGKRYKNRIRKVSERHGISDGVIDVYLEFYKGITRYFSERNLGRGD